MHTWARARRNSTLVLDVIGLACGAVESGASLAPCAVRGSVLSQTRGRPSLAAGQAGPDSNVTTWNVRVLLEEVGGLEVIDLVRTGH